jgi:peptidoglycan/LPS O-acetylase OafA/YrhL
MFFYLMFPLSTLLIRRASWRNVLLTAAASCALTRVMWAAGISDGIKPLIHLADFIMGIAACCAFHLLERRTRPPAGWWLYIPGVALAALVIAYPEILPFGIDLNSALRPLNGLLLIGFAFGGGLLARVLSAGPAVYLGKSSYALYILHIPIMWWYLRWSHSFSPTLYILLVIAISALVYSFFEEPANHVLRRLTGPLQP